MARMMSGMRRMSWGRKLRELRYLGAVALTKELMLEGKTREESIELSSIKFNVARKFIEDLLEELDKEADDAKTDA